MSEGPPGEDPKWRAYWDHKTEDVVTDYEFDRGANPRPAALEALSVAEFLAFVDPQPGDVLLDAGCGTGVNIVPLHQRVKRIVAVDFSDEALSRCRRRIEALRIENVAIQQGSVTHLNVPDASVDRIICMSVLHYLDDEQVQAALYEFARVLSDGGTLVLHVKNLASLYLGTLTLAKRAKKMLGWPVILEHFRPFDWYVRALQAAGFTLQDYNSFNLAVVDRMPRRWVHTLQRLELEHHRRLPLKLSFFRRHGADLKLKARRTGP